MADAAPEGPLLGSHAVTVKFPALSIVTPRRPSTARTTALGAHDRHEAKLSEDDWRRDARPAGDGPTLTPNECPNGTGIRAMRRLRRSSSVLISSVDSALVAEPPPTSRAKSFSPSGTSVAYEADDGAALVRSVKSPLLRVRIAALTERAPPHTLAPVSLQSALSPRVPESKEDASGMSGVMSPRVPSLLPRAHGSTLLRVAVVERRESGSPASSPSSSSSRSPSSALPRLMPKFPSSESSASSTRGAILSGFGSNDEDSSTEAVVLSPGLHSPSGATRRPSPLAARRMYVERSNPLVFSGLHAPPDA